MAILKDNMMLNNKQILISISIIIPMYNAEKFIENTLISIIKQTLKNIEIIVVDDASTDNSYEIIQKLSRNDERIKIIRLNENYGSPSYPRNIGVDNASGEFVTFVDADDTIDCDMYEKMYYKAKEDNSDIVVCGYKEVDENNKLISIKEFNECNLNFEDILELTINPATWNKIYKRKLFIKNNIQFQHKIFCEDLGNTHELFYFAKKISLVNEPLYNYLVALQGASQQKINKKYIDDIFKALEINKVFLLRQNIFNQYRISFFKRYIEQLNMVHNKICEYNNKELINYYGTLLNDNIIFSIDDLLFILKDNQDMVINLLMIFKIYHVRFDLTIMPSKIQSFIKHCQLSPFLDLQVKLYKLYHNNIKEVFIYGYGKTFKSIDNVLNKLGIKILGIIETINNKRELKYPYGTLDTFVSTIHDTNILIISKTYQDEITLNIQLFKKKLQLDIQIL